MIAQCGLLSWRETEDATNLDDVVIHLGNQLVDSVELVHSTQVLDEFDDDNVVIEVKRVIDDKSLEASRTLALESRICPD